MGRKKQELKQLSRVDLDAVTLTAAHRARRPSEDSIEMQAQAIRSRGMTEPLLLIREEAHRLRLVSGLLRFRAAERLGLPQVEAIVLGPEFRRHARVIERLQRGDYDVWELADTLEELKNRCEWTQAQVGLAIGRTRDFVANILAITQIGPEARELIGRSQADHPMSARHLRYVARAARSEQPAVARRILSERLSTTELERRKREEATRDPGGPLIKVRDLRRPGTARFPRNAKEWRRYHRQLSTDLRRIDRQETRELQRAESAIALAKQRQRQVKREAARRRRELTRELRLIQRQFARLGTDR